jgi:hypothetical protein
MADGPIPIHFFSLEQFSLLVTLLDTLPDFFLYLASRWGLHDLKVVPPDSDPLDEWALATFERTRLLKILDDKTFTNISGLLDKYRGATREIERKEKPSYFIDRLMNQFSSGIGHDFPVDPRFNLIAPPNSQEAYDIQLRFFARLNRQERSQFVEFLMNKVACCKRQPLAFRGFKFDERSEDAYLVLASRMDRDSRRVALCNVLAGTALKLDARNVVGMAVSHEWPATQDCDVAAVNAVDIKTTARFRNVIGEAFGKVRFPKK